MDQSWGPSIAICVALIIIIAVIIALVVDIRGQPLTPLTPGQVSQQQPQVVFQQVVPAPGQMIPAPAQAPRCVESASFDDSSIRSRTVYDYDSETESASEQITEQYPDSLSWSSTTGLPTSAENSRSRPIMWVGSLDNPSWLSTPDYGYFSHAKGKQLPEIDVATVDTHSGSDILYIHDVNSGIFRMDTDDISPKWNIIHSTEDLSGEISDLRATGPGELEIVTQSTAYKYNNGKLINSLQSEFEERTRQCGGGECHVKMNKGKRRSGLTFVNGKEEILYPSSAIAYDATSKYAAFVSRDGRVSVAKTSSKGLSKLRTFRGKIPASSRNRVAVAIGASKVYIYSTQKQNVSRLHV